MILGLTLKLVCANVSRSNL